MNSYNSLNHQIRNELSVGAIVFFSIFFAMGFYVIIYGGKLITESIDFKANAISTEGNVIELVVKKTDDGEFTYFPIISYEVDGNIYLLQHSLASTPPAYNKGEAVEVLYLRNEHENGRLGSFWGFWGGPIFLILGGAFFSLIGVGGVYSIISNYNMRKRVLSTGVRIFANFDGVDFENPDKGTSYWTILANWQNPADGKLYLFESDSLYFNPEKYFSSQKVPVLINQNNPHEYIVDLSNLPQEA